MSRIGKKPILIKEKTEITISDSSVKVKGPLGELSMDYLPVIEIKKEENQIVLVPKKNDIKTNALWGTYSSLISNMIQGVTEGYKKTLIIEGVGYRAEIKNNKIVLKVGFSHEVEIDIPNDLKVEIEKEKIIISGIEKQKVGQLAAVIRKIKKPEPYKGKGIRYEDEIIRRKEGKKTA